MYAIFKRRCILNWDIENPFSNIRFHSGRTDQDGGHRDWKNRTGNGIGSYHYHHGLPAHLHPNGACPYGSKQTSIINPYTGKKISLGQPYIIPYYEEDSSNVEYYSLNLVSKALTAYDTIGVELALNNTGGIFHACSTGDSSMTNLGEEFAFSYPKFLGFRQDNTLFKTNNGKLQLLCHTKKATLDDIECYAYISLESIGIYMTKDNYFTELCNNARGVWSFKLSDDVSEPRVNIISPMNGELFSRGDNLKVDVNIIKAVNANLIIGEYNEFIGNLENQKKVIFSNYTLTNKDIGELSLKVEISTATGTATAASTVQIQVTQPSIDKQINEIKLNKSEKINDFYRTLYNSEAVIHASGVWESTLCGLDIVDYVNQNNIIVERDKDYSMYINSYGVNTSTQYFIYKDSVNNPMSYGDFMNICGPYWEEDWKTLWSKELYDSLNIVSIFVMGYFAISNIQLSKININIPKINWGGIADTGYGTIYVAPSIAMTTSSVWSIDISGVPSLLLEQITFSIANNGISGSPNSGDGTGKLKIDDKQFGKKVGKHAEDFNLDASKAESRDFVRNKIDEIFNNATEIRQGEWRGLGEKLPNGSNAPGQAKFYIQSNDVVVTDMNGNFVTILKDGINNLRVISGTKIWP